MPTINKRDYKLRMEYLRSNGIPVNGVTLRRDIERKYNDHIDDAQFSKAINHNLRTERGDTIRRYVDEFLTLYENQLKEEPA